ncbi:helix-turn-helix domain-containing protein [Fischerella sp. PCC 9605]|uniref:helix-turn-helix domain-containing protein n=1 Tax=Fischerella sp. PCC 9605 TaxID=1173024 RepID=UPI00047B56E4|nr:helix-turn-helix transcriptional regulator [Fischerella sp. PCC 9605]
MQNFVSVDGLDLHWRLFDEMMNRFNLSVNETAKAAGISRVVLSRFRHGKADLGAAKLIALLLVVPQEARMWYLSELFGVIPSHSLRSMIAQAPPEEQAEVLRLMADLFVSNNRTTANTAELAKAV